jgi:hypothetical protein
MGRTGALWYSLFAFLLFGQMKSAYAQFTLVNVGHITNNSSGPGNPVISGNVAYLPSTFSGYGLRVFDISNLSASRNVTNVDTGGNGISVAAFGSFAYLVDTYHGLLLYDISNPTNPVLLWDFTNDDLQISQGRVVKVAGHYLYLGSNFSVKMFNLADPVEPGWPVGAGSIRLTNAIVKDLAVSGNYLYVANSSDGVHIYNISDPAHTTNVGFISEGATGGYASSIALYDHYAYLANYSDGLRIYNVSSPASPVNIGHVNNGGSATGVAVSGGYAYLANDTNGLYVYDISDPANPVSVTHADAKKAEGVVVAAGYIYLDEWIYSGNRNDIRVYSLAGPPLHITLTTTNMTLISWSSPSPNLVLQVTADLSGNNWADVTNAPTGVAGENQLVLPQPAANQYYRLRSL